MAYKAGEVDASIKKAAIRTARSYEGRAPSKTNETKALQSNLIVGLKVA